MIEEIEIETEEDLEVGLMKMEDHKEEIIEIVTEITETIEIEIIIMMIDTEMKIDPEEMMID